MDIFINGLQDIVGNGQLQLFIIGFLVFKLLDFLTGVSKGIKNKNLKSSLIKQGFVALASEFIAIIFGGVLGIMVGSPIVAITAILTALIFKEGLSIVENLVDLGVPIPDKVKDILAVFNTNKEDKE